MSRAALHQIKWLHVHPPNGGGPGRVNIYTVVTGTYSLFGLVYRERVQDADALDESDVFAIPDGIKLLEAPEGRACVSYSPVQGASSTIFDKLVASLDDGDGGIAVDPANDSTCDPREGLVETKSYIGCNSLASGPHFHILGFIASLF